MYRKTYGQAGSKGGGFEGKGKGGAGLEGKGKGGGGSEGKGKGKGDGSGGQAVSRVLKNKANYHKKKQEGTAPKAPKTCFNYGPKKNRDRFKLDLDFIRSRMFWLGKDLEESEKEKEKEEEEARIPEEEVKDLPELLVQKINFHMLGKPPSGSDKKLPGNAKKHHTDKFACCKGKDAEPVLRRGQEFKITLTFSRKYNLDQDDLIFIVEADEDQPGKGLSTNFKLDEERKTPFTEGQHWAARIKKMLPDKNALKVAIYIPGKLPVGQWDFKVKTSLRGSVRKLVYTHPKPITVLFNPWSAQDQVYCEDVDSLKEYVLNSQGSAYFGSTYSIGSKPWDYDQFKPGILQISLMLLRQAFGWKMTSSMGNPALVARALSKIVNSCDDDGVLTGNWSGNYEGGTKPTAWKSSASILQLYCDSKEPVCYGQCWVFSHVLTAVCRALGLPCRSVTNFDSAHDTDGSMTIDQFYDEEGKEQTGMKSDSIWNFHVWNEVWMQRPDLVDFDCNGWQVIDATPQELSGEVFQCGPCPVKAVKEGLVQVQYDAGFIFSEVNADVVNWIVKGEGDDKEFIKSSTKRNRVGCRISTKPPNGKPHEAPRYRREMNDPKYREDITWHYKHPEGSQQERAAVKRAVLQGSRGDDFFEEGSTALDVDFDESEEECMIGNDLKVTIVVKNQSQETKEMDPLLAARTCSYWDSADLSKSLCKEKPGVCAIPAGGQKKFSITVPSAMYTAACDESMTVYVYARVKDTKTNMYYTAQHPFNMTLPEMEVKTPDSTHPQKEMPVQVIITNPLNVPLTHCYLTMSGPMLQCENDPNMFESFVFSRYYDHRKLEPNETVTLTLKMYVPEEEKEEDDSDEEDPDDDGEEAEAPEPEPEEAMKTQTFEFFCSELETMTGSCTVKCCKQH